MLFKNQIEFEEHIGLIRDPDELALMNAPKIDDSCMYDTERLEELQRWINETEYRINNIHIATLTSDHDNAELKPGEYCITMSNIVRKVNRVGYYLCIGSKDDVCLEEVGSYSDFNG